MLASLNVNIKTGLLEGVEYIPSPNYNARPIDTVIDLLVIHGISLPPGEFGGNGVTALFTNTLDPSLHTYYNEVAKLRVSSHAFIRRTGEIIQYVPIFQRAWHAGESVFAGRSNCNDFSIGIELEGTDLVPYEKVQYNRLADLVCVLIRAYPTITVDRIVGHSDIAPGRKTDPGPAFDWEYFRNLLFVKT